MRGIGGGAALLACAVFGVIGILAKPESQSESESGSQTVSVIRPIPDSDSDSNSDSDSPPPNFPTLLAQAKAALPTVSRLRSHLAAHPEQAHHYPDPLAEAGELLGRIAQEVTDHPALAEQAQAFYAQCAADGEGLTPVRALCYSHLIGTAAALPEGAVPDEVVGLAQQATL